MGKRGFTLIELVMIIVILGILAAVAIPKFIDLQTDAENAAIRALYGQIISAYSITIASVKGNPTVDQVNANLSGDAGSLTVNGGSTIQIQSGANMIAGGKRTGRFTVNLLGTAITSIGTLSISSS